MRIFLIDEFSDNSVYHFSRSNSNFCLSFFYDCRVNIYALAEFSSLIRSVFLCLSFHGVCRVKKPYLVHFFYVEIFNIEIHFHRYLHLVIFICHGKIRVLSGQILVLLRSSDIIDIIFFVFYFVINSDIRYTVCHHGENFISSDIVQSWNNQIITALDICPQTNSRQRKRTFSGCFRKTVYRYCSICRWEHFYITSIDTRSNPDDPRNVFLYFQTIDRKILFCESIS